MLRLSRKEYDIPPWENAGMREISSFPAFRRKLISMSVKGIFIRLLLLHRNRTSVRHKYELCKELVGLARLAE